MIYGPTYEDKYFSTTGASLEYTIRVSGDSSDSGIVFNGKSWKSPSEDYLDINITKLCKDWVEMEMIDFRLLTDTVVSNEDACKAFELCSGDTVLETYVFLSDNSYESEWEGEGMSLSHPINGNADARMKLMYTEYNE